MSIPDRLWRVAKGYWSAGEKSLRSIEDKLAEADAYRELADVLKPHTLPPGAGSGTAIPGSGTAPHSAGPLPPGQHDPVLAAYAVLRLDPGSDLAAVEAAYTDRAAELRIDEHAPGSPERLALEGKRAALTAAYERLRDTLNPTEARFEMLEF